VKTYLGQFHPKIKITNILRETFLSILFFQKNTNPNCWYRKALQNTATSLLISFCQKLQIQTVNSTKK
jgi:hypothetical protein